MNKSRVAFVVLGLSTFLSSESHCVMRTVNLNLESGRNILNAHGAFMIAERATISAKEFRNESGSFVSFHRMQTTNETKFVFSDTNRLMIETRGPVRITLDSTEGPDCEMYFLGDDGTSDDIGLYVDAYAKTVRLRLYAGKGEVKIWIPSSCRGEIVDIKSTESRIFGHRASADTSAGVAEVD